MSVKVTAMSKLRLLAKTIVFGSASSLGVTKALIRRESGKGILILCYHGVVPDSHLGEFLYRNTVSIREFSNHLEFLSRRFHFISPAELTAAAIEGKPLPERPAMISFDDGYRNNLLYAAPVLRKFGISSLFSVVTGLIGTPNVLWTESVNLCVLDWPGRTMPVPQKEGGYKAILLPSAPQDRVQLAHTVRQACKEMDSEALEQYLCLLRSEVPAARMDLYHELLAFMSWDEVRTLHSQGFAIASHTVSHPILSRIPDAELQRELGKSRQRIEDELGVPCPWLVYPNGQKPDYSPEVFRRAREAGYQMGFTATGGYGRLGRELFEVDRIGVPGHRPMPEFEAGVSGFRRYIA
jgi:peptidoglycan/xylan/chitin deacetylase (PgdA/CDA1 family)